MYKNGSDFLNKLYQNMHMEESVMHTAEKQDTPDEKISRYLDRLERTHDKAKTSSHKMDILKEFYYKKYIIKELPESYVELQKRIAKEEGHGNIEVTEDMKKKLLESIQTNQKKSLDTWIEYLSSDDAIYPMWFKNYAFQGMLKLSSFDKEKREFGKRTSSTTNPYIELNREVLAQVYNILSKEVEGKELTDEQVKALENGISFKKLYTYYLTKQNYTTDQNKSNEGIWIKYDQGSNSEVLCNTLQGKNTGWCTAGYETAKYQLENGDFYIYYTKNIEGEYTEPRIAIRMNGQDEIAEVRGIVKDQNIEPEMVEIADKKLDEFPDKEQYKKKVHDMKKLTEIDKKVEANIDLTEEELKFLYEINYEIEGFGWKKDPRIEEIRSKRDNVKDLNKIFENIKEIKGSLDLSYLEEVSGLKLPKKIEGKLNLRSLRTAEDLELPNSIGGSLYLDGLETAEGLVLPKSIGGDLNLNGLGIAEGLKLPESIKGALYLGSLKTAEGLKLPENIGGVLWLGSLETAQGLKLPKTIITSLDLSNLKTAEGLELPNSIGGVLWLDSLKTAEGLKLPESIWGLDLSGLETAEGLELPKTIITSLDLNNLKTAEGLVLPKSIGWNLDLSNLETAKGLVLPKSIGWNLDLSNLKTAEGLVFPESYRNITKKLPSYISEDMIKYIPDEEYFNKNDDDTKKTL